MNLLPKKITILFISILFFSINAYAQPKLIIDGGNMHNWGIVKPIESPLKTTIKLRNGGDKPLRIFKTKPGCGCTVTKLDKDVIQPGDYATFSVKLDLLTKTGELTKTIDITTNDPNQKMVQYILKCEVMVPLMKFPKFLNFGKITVGKEAKAQIQVDNKVEEDIKVMKIYKSDQDIDLSFKVGDVLRAGQSYNLIAKYTPKKEGKVNFDITIMTDNVDMPRLKVSGWGKAEK